MTTFSSEQLNFFKFAAVVFDEFPVALRQAFKDRWDSQVAPLPGFQKWDDSPLVRNMFLSKEGGKTKYVPTSKSYMEWDCTALFEATLYAKSFALPDGSGGSATLHKLYVKPCHLSSGAFHHSVVSPSGNQAESFALALDQLRLLRNSLCHQISTQNIDKATFDRYIMLSKDAFAALRQNSKKIDDIGKLGEKDFPTARLQRLEEQLRREKFKQIEDNLNEIESQLKYIGSDLKDLQTGFSCGLSDVKTNIKEVGLDVIDMKTGVTDVNTKVEDFGLDLNEVNTRVKEVKKTLEDVGSDVKAALEEVETKVEQIGSDLKEVKSEVTEVKIKVENVGSVVKMALTDVKSKVEEVRLDVQSAVTDVKTKVEEVRLDLTRVKTNVDDIKQAMRDGISKESGRSNLLGKHDDTACSDHELGAVNLDVGHQKRAMEKATQKATPLRSNLFNDDEDTACTCVAI